MYKNYTKYTRKLQENTSFSSVNLENKNNIPKQTKI